MGLALSGGLQSSAWGRADLGRRAVIGVWDLGPTLCQLMTVLVNHNTLLLDIPSALWPGGGGKGNRETKHAWGNWHPHSIWSFISVSGGNPGFAPKFRTPYLSTFYLHPSLLKYITNGIKSISQPERMSKPWAQTRCPLGSTTTAAVPGRQPSQGPGLLKAQGPSLARLAACQVVKAPVCRQWAEQWSVASSLHLRSSPSQPVQIFVYLE